MNSTGQTMMGLRRSFKNSLRVSPRTLMNLTEVLQDHHTQTRGKEHPSHDSMWWQEAQALDKQNHLGHASQTQQIVQEEVGYKKIQSYRKLQEDQVKDTESSKTSILASCREIDLGDPDNEDRPGKQKRFWSFIKSLKIILGLHHSRTKARRTWTRRTRPTYLIISMNLSTPKKIKMEMSQVSKVGLIRLCLISPCLRQGCWSSWRWSTKARPVVQIWYQPG